MLLTYTIKVDAFNIVLRCLPPEIENTDILLVYRVHDANMEVKNADVVEHKEVVFILNVPKEELTSKCITMQISAYKYHPTGIKILVANIEVSVQLFIQSAMRKLGELVALPGNYTLQNPGRVNGADLTSIIHLTIEEDIDLSELYSRSPRKERPTSGNTSSSIKSSGD